MMATPVIRSLGVANAALRTSIGFVRPALGSTCGPAGSLLVGSGAVPSVMPMLAVRHISGDHPGVGQRDSPPPPQSPQSPPIWIVKVGDGNRLDFDAEGSMTAIKLLVALEQSESFKGKLKDMALSKCDVWVCRSPSNKAPSPEEEAKAVLLEGAETLGDVIKGMPAGNVFIHVRLPRSASSGLSDVAKMVQGMAVRAKTFKDALLHARQVPIEDGCELLILPDTAAGKPVHWLNMESNTLFVRPIFKLFYEQLLQAFSDDVIPHRRHKLLRGVSGIGKSSFGQYVLWRLAKEGRNVLYEYPRGLGKGMVVVFGAAVSDVYIVDGCEPSVAGPATLLISEPRGWDVIYHQFQKQAVSLYMPTPTPDEILLMRKHCFMGNDRKSGGSAVADDALDVAEVEERMARWGPIPLHVLDQVDEERDKLEGAIAIQKVSALHELVRTMSEQVAVRDVSFRVVHYNISDDYSRVTYRWASPYVSKRVMQVLALQQRTDRFALLASMLKDRAWLDMCADLFEEWCGYQMAAGGSCRIRRLGVGSLAGQGRLADEELTETQQQQLALFQQADSLLGVTLDGDGRGILGINPSKKETQLLQAATDLPAAVHFRGRRFRARDCFAAADFIEAAGVCSNATVNTAQNIMLLGKNTSNGLLPLTRRLHPELPWAQPGSPLRPIPILVLVPQLVFDECIAGPMNIAEPKDPKKPASSGDMATYQSDLAAYQAALADVGAARRLAPWVVQYAVAVPHPSEDGKVTAATVAPEAGGHSS